MRVLLFLCLTAFGCSGSFGKCEIASAIRKAAETGEGIACGGERVGVSPVTGVGGEVDREVYTISIE